MPNGNLMNGYFRTPMDPHTGTTIVLFLSESKNSLTIDKLPLDSSSLQSHSWLAGFTEADGYFGLVLEYCASLKSYGGVNDLRVEDLKERSLVFPLGSRND
jgi:hypothetical protein